MSVKFIREKMIENYQRELDELVESCIANGTYGQLIADINDPVKCLEGNASRYLVLQSFVEQCAFNESMNELERLHDVSQ